MKVTLVICTIFAIAALASAKYLLAPIQMRFISAAIYCKVKNMTLVLPRSEKEAQNLYNYVRVNRLNPSNDTGVIRAWLYGSKKNNIWVDSRGQEIKKSYFGPEEPNNHLNHETCLELRILAKNGITRYWNDAPCNRKNNVICQEKPDPRT